MLKQDPNDISAAALVVISQALVAISTGNTSANPLASAPPEQDNTPDFVPSRVAVIVNTLWYMSLSLSIATAFLAMLAKDWCYSFSAHRTGHPRDQAHRRQRKWKLIERWKMEELIELLPGLMHLSLRLCVYLWDLNHATAIPVICIAATFLVFYILSSITASIVEDFPYTTILSRILRSDPMRLFLQRSRFLILLLLVVISSGIITPLSTLGWTLMLLIFLLASLFLTLDRYLLQFFAKPGDDGCKVLSSSVDAVWVLLQMIMYPIVILRSSIDAGVNHVVQRLEVTEDLTTSLALGWLLQYCETASAVDIALQAIAGASRRIPKEPLLSNHATEQIMRRIVTHNDKSMHDLYTRSLGFLGFKSGANTMGEKDRTIGDVEVMVWDLKSKNEREVADLINDGSFIPSDDNLEAIKIGNSVASQSLPFLMGQAKDTTASLDSIINLLSRHCDSKDNQLHPAAVQSLANAAALYTSLSTSPERPSNLAILCMKYCERLIREQPDDGSPGSTHSIETAAVFILCVLLHRRSSRGDPLHTTSPTSQLRTRVLHAIRILVDSNTEGARFQKYIFWIGCSEILSNRSEYGLNQGSDDWNSLEDWCSTFASTFVHDSGNPLIPRWNLDKQSTYFERNLFLGAIKQVYELLAVSQSDGSTPIHPPEPLYTILTTIACGKSLDSKQSEACAELLSNFEFPRLNEASITSLKMLVSLKDFRDSTKTVLSLIGATYTRNTHPHGRRQFAAAQLWLLLHRVGDSASDDQQRWKQIIENNLEVNLKFQSKGFDQVKQDLETFIIEGYRKDRRISDKITDNEGQSPSIWGTIKCGLPMGMTIYVTPRLSICFSRRLGQIRGALRTDVEGGRSRGKHQRAYTARIIQRILETRESQGNEDLDALIEEDFRELLPCFQRLLPIFAPLPPSRETSEVSLETQIEIASAGDTTAEHAATGAGAGTGTGTGHVSVSMLHPPGPPELGDH
ncbi:hypothetical protein FRC11_004790 [Ceratobasidium sp. 423]|nr:hypothetical protein FRC11_004790 [Ceratobasidium sp. 423]